MWPPWGCLTITLSLSLSFWHLFLCVFRIAFFKLCIMTVGHKINELDCDQQLNKQTKKRIAECVHIVSYELFQFST